MSDNFMIVSGSRYNGNPYTGSFILPKHHPGTSLISDILLILWHFQALHSYDLLSGILLFFGIRYTTLYFEKLKILGI